MKTKIVYNNDRSKTTPDPYYPAAVENARAAYLDLLNRGIIDKDGHRIRKDLPADMQEGQDRDFGG